MLKIIDGIRYDTDKARFIGEAEATVPLSDFRYWKEALYAGKRSGRFFLYGRGGALTQWGKTVDGNARTGGEGIKPLSAEQALAWCENCLDGTDWQDNFKQMIEEA